MPTAFRRRRCGSLVPTRKMKQAARLVTPPQSGAAGGGSDDKLVTKNLLQLKKKTSALRQKAGTYIRIME
ncbi:hypothetical protein EYF80_029387 [Liparis tanakae]|uniref:Uncharacterized protein n=1 Tax=Liparis tanakae TaxID=230148 RepID=A0A4Z2H3H8_9TELE|nr:hypothetical protein EYF80_029387 [Liparis tanakae]